jgi:hypothetical protein
VPEAATRRRQHQELSRSSQFLLAAEVPVSVQLLHEIILWLSR